MCAACERWDLTLLMLLSMNVLFCIGIFSGTHTAHSPQVAYACEKEKQVIPGKL